MKSPYLAYVTRGKDGDVEANLVVSSACDFEQCVNELRKSWDSCSVHLVPWPYWGGNFTHFMVLEGPPKVADVFHFGRHRLKGEFILACYNVHSANPEGTGGMFFGGEDVAEAAFTGLLEMQDFWGEGVYEDDVTYH